MFGKPKTPALPPLEPPAPMPDPEDELLKMRKRREAASTVQSGRMGTILSDSAQTLGGY